MITEMFIIALYMANISDFNCLISGELADLSMPAHERRIQSGIPMEAFYLVCPDEDLKCSVLKEFILLDNKYVERLEQLAAQHEYAIR